MNKQEILKMIRSIKRSSAVIIDDVSPSIISIMTDDSKIVISSNANQNVCVDVHPTLNPTRIKRQVH